MGVGLQSVSPKVFKIDMTKIREKCNCVTHTKNEGFLTPSLDTLAQLDHFTENQAYKTLKKRSLAKYYTNEILYPLIDLKNEREDSYWNTYHCVKTMLQDTEGKVTAKYCKNRWCIVCNRIRTATLINRYHKPLSALDTRFVTLTTNLSSECKTKEDLERVLKDYKDTFTRIWRRLKRKYGTTSAIRKIETTWNYKHNHYHPHFHVILENKSSEAEFLVTQWLKEYPQAKRKAQDISVTSDNAILELFKYFTKMWSRITDENTTKEKRVLPYPPQVMDSIFEVMYRQRTIQTYGTHFPTFDEDFDTDVATIFTSEIREHSIIWEWEQDLQTWVDYNTGELRTY